METSLQGTDGEETVTVDNLGKVLKIDDSTRVEPFAGNDTYLTIDSSWQSAIYQILKQRVAGILLSKIEASKTYDFSVNDAAQIKIPIYDVYNALIANSVIDINKFSDANASDCLLYTSNGILACMSRDFGVFMPKHLAGQWCVNSNPVTIKFT